MLYYQLYLDGCEYLHPKILHELRINLKNYQILEKKL